MKFAYTRTGGPLLNWSGATPPSPTRAGETRSLGGFNVDVPRPGAPEVVSGYESPAPGAAIVHLGGYMPEGAARNYGQATVGADDAPRQLDMALVRKASVLAALYHGVKRNNGSVWWGLAWALGAYVAPLHGTSAVGIAAAQGFGHAKPKRNPARRARRRR